MKQNIRIFQVLMPMKHMNQTEILLALMRFLVGTRFCVIGGGHSDLGPGRSHQGVVRIVTSLNEVHGCGENRN